MRVTFELIGEGTEWTLSYEGTEDKVTSLLEHLTTKESPDILTAMNFHRGESQS